MEKQVSEDHTKGVSLVSEIFKNSSSTYKYYWFLSILDEFVINKKSRISIWDLIISMIALAWFPVNRSRLSFGKTDSMHDYIKLIRKETGLGLNSDEREIQETLNAELDKGNKVLSSELIKLSHYVPYCFLSPWLHESNKAKVIELSQNFHNDVPYKLEKTDNGLVVVINEKWRNYLIVNYEILKDFTCWNLALYLQHKNPQSWNILQKLLPDYKKRKTSTKSTEETTSATTKGSEREIIPDISQDIEVTKPTCKSSSKPEERTTSIQLSAADRLVQIVKAIGFAANNAPDDLQFLELITKQIIDSCNTEAEDNTFLEEILKLVSNKKYIVGLSNYNEICIITIHVIVKLMLAGKSDKTIIQEILNITKEKSDKPDKKAKDTPESPDTIPSSLAHTDPSPTKGQLIATLSHKDRALHYANVIVKELLQEYKTGNNKLSFKEFLVNECNQRIHGNLFLTEERIETEGNKMRSNASNKKTSINANALTPKTNDGDLEIQEIIDIADHMTSMGLHHNEQNHMGGEGNKNEYKNKNSWEIFNDFVIQKHDNRDDARFSILYQLLIKAVQMTEEGKSKEEIITYLRSLNIEHRDIEKRNPGIKTKDPSKYKTDEGYLYTADAIHLLQILREVCKPPQMKSLLEKGVWVINSYFKESQDGNLFSYIIERLQKGNNYNLSLDSQSLVECCQLLLDGMDDEAIIDHIRKNYINFDFREDCHTTPSTAKRNMIISEKSETESHRIMTNNESITRLFTKCLIVSNSYSADSMERKVYPIVNDCYYRYKNSKSKMSFIKFLKLNEGCEGKYKRAYDIIINEYEKILKIDTENNFWNRILAPLNGNNGIDSQNNEPLGDILINQDTNGLYECRLNYRLILEPSYQKIKQCYNRSFLLVKKNNLYGIYWIRDQKATKYLGIKYNQISHLYKNNYLVKINNRYGIICLGCKGKYVEQPIYTSLIQKKSNPEIIYLKTKDTRKTIVLK